MLFFRFKALIFLLAVDRTWHNKKIEYYCLNTTHVNDILALGLVRFHCQFPGLLLFLSVLALLILAFSLPADLLVLLLLFVFLGFFVLVVLLVFLCRLLLAALDSRILASWECMRN